MCSFESETFTFDIFLLGGQEKAIPGTCTADERSLGQETADHFKDSSQGKYCRVYIKWNLLSHALKSPYCKKCGGVLISGCLQVKGKEEGSV